MRLDHWIKVPGPEIQSSSNTFLPDPRSVSPVLLLLFPTFLYNQELSICLCCMNPTTVGILRE